MKCGLRHVLKAGGFQLFVSEHLRERLQQVDFKLGLSTLNISILTRLFFGDVIAK